METYTQDDVEGLRRLIQDEAWKKLVRLVEGRIKALDHSQEATLADIKIEAVAARMIQLRHAGEKMGLEFFIQKPEQMLKRVINEPSPTTTEKKD